MNPLIRFTALAAFGGWLMTAAAWADDAKVTPVASRATPSTTASSSASSTGQPAGAESAKVAIRTSNQPAVVADTVPDPAATVSAAAAGAAASAHEGVAVVKAPDQPDHPGTADAVTAGPGDPLTAAVIDDSALSNARGGADTHTNQNTSTGAVTGNVASQLNTGSNTISDGSFANVSGIPIVIQNSGNNVLIQNSTILNLQLESPK